MERLLELLYDRYDRRRAVEFLRDERARAGALADLAAELVAAGMPPEMGSSEEGQNLFVAVLTLRVKFPIEEARQKVALNIAMRERRSV